MLHQQTHLTTHTDKGVGTVVVSSSSIILFIAISQENLQSRALQLRCCQFCGQCNIKSSPCHSVMWSTAVAA